MENCVPWLKIPILAALLVIRKNVRGGSMAVALSWRLLKTCQNLSSKT